MSNRAGSVKVDVIAGRNLVAMDKSMFGKGSSDPYCVVSDGTGKRIGKSPHINKNLNPEWNFSCEFKLAIGSSPNVVIEIVDHDNVGSGDPMGKVVLDISHLQDGVTDKNWHPLVVSEKGGKASGDILVATTFTERKTLSQGQEFAPDEVLRSVRVGLAWDSFDTTNPIDLDASAVCFDNTGKVAGVVYFGQTRSLDGAMIHTGDSRSGAEAGDDESIVCHLHKLPANVLAIFFVVTAYKPSTSFDQVETARVCLYDENDKSEYCSMRVGAQGPHSAMIMCRLVRHQGMWIFNALGTFVQDARDYGSLMPELKEGLQDVIPNIRFGPEDRVAVMRKGSEVQIAAMSGDVNRVAMGLGWDSNGIDLDASCIIMDQSHNVMEIISFSHLHAGNHSVEHSGDNRTGVGSGDDETITVHVDKLDDRAIYLVFIVNSFSGQTFDRVANTYCRLFAPPGQEFCRFQLSGSEYRCTGLLMSMLSRTEGHWKMTAIGEGCTERFASGCVDEVQEYLRTGKVERRF
eukprot:c45422_g1_i1.p1 GENE.c45422_g1_i1~~c45422_g1_i1.p1  ORF type:complete len:517 (-),score=119.07 c45422_g1_i1:81-1631(-)